MKPSISHFNHPTTGEIIYITRFSDNSFSYTAQPLVCSSCGTKCKSAMFIKTPNGKNSQLLCFVRLYKRNRNKKFKYVCAANRETLKDLYDKTKSDHLLMLLVEKMEHEDG